LFGIRWNGGKPVGLPQGESNRKACRSPCGSNKAAIDSASRYPGAGQALRARSGHGAAMQSLVSKDKALATLRGLDAIHLASALWFNARAVSSIDFAVFRCSIGGLLQQRKAPG